MGAHLCSFKQPRPEEGSPMHDESSDRSTYENLSLTELLNSGRAENKKRPLHVQYHTNKKSKSLEDCLLDSPSYLKDDHFLGGELHILQHSPRKNVSSPPMESWYMHMSQQFSKKYSSPTRVHPHLLSNTARDYYSIEQLAKVDEGKTEDSFVSSISRSQSGKSKKRVSFRMPEEADIFIIYSPKEDAGERKSVKGIHPLYEQ
ncbi:hypothetical protein IFM89_027304 [Coptis chinensis]|uniref:Uncharacterized protein n=1 Tax=Coptis chinensis TaxID=261450 RepID=A0A835I5V8_9MAGN|nr:hypothetical protein IFM89_027304 [Coptis chinensis]